MYECATQSGGKTTSNAEISEPIENLATRQETEFFEVDGMCLEFYGRCAREAEDPSQSLRRLKRCQREEKVHETVTSRQKTIHYVAIDAVQNVLLATGKREISPNDSAKRQQFTQKHVGAEV